MCWALSVTKNTTMRRSVIAFCLLGSLVIGAFVTEILYTNYVLSNFKHSEINVLTQEQYEEFPHELLAELLGMSQSNELFQRNFANELQTKLIPAIIALSVWLIFLLVVILCSRTKALWASG